MCKVSVLIPVYNVERYLVPCMESVIRQTLEDIEIICINDGSTDGSLSILRRYEAMDGRVRVIDKKNTGYGHSMNLGLKAARGEYIGIVESDDFADGCMFERLYHAARVERVPVVRSNFMTYTGGVDTFTEPLAGLPYGTTVNPCRMRELFYAAPSIWAGIYDRSFLQKHHIRFNETPGASYQDVSFYFSVLACAEKVYLMRDAFLHYRMDNPASSVKSKEKVYCIFDEFDRFSDFLAEWGLSDKNLQYLIPALKFRHCIGHFFRIADVYRSAFLRRMEAELRDAERRELLVRAYWKYPSDWVQMQALLCGFGYERFRYAEFLARQELRAYQAAADAEMRRYSMIYVYGAGQVGREVAAYLRRNGFALSGFLVSAREGNPSTLHEAPVYALDEMGDDARAALILVAVKEASQYEIIEALRRRGFSHILAMNVKLRKALARDEDYVAREAWEMACRGR